MTGKGTRLYGICGIDEAGRGPMIGPMVICGVLISPESMHEIEKLEVRDSKTLSPSRRLALSKKIKTKVIATSFRSISALEIDKRRKHTTLNEIEVDEFASILKELTPKTAYLDAADVKADRFGRKVGERSGLKERGADIISEHKADSKYPIVSAASILAKVERDRMISEYHKKYGDFGSGYPSDSKTVDFVRNLVKTRSKLPPIVRMSWESVRRIIDAELNKQSTLDSL
jgi:ribonuclease HII